MIDFNADILVESLASATNILKTDYIAQELSNRVVIMISTDNSGDVSNVKDEQLSVAFVGDQSNTSNFNAPDVIYFLSTDGFDALNQRVLSCGGATLKGDAFSKKTADDLFNSRLIPPTVSDVSCDVGTSFGLVDSYTGVECRIGLKMNDITGVPEWVIS